MKERAAQIASRQLRNRRTIWVTAPRDPRARCPLVIFLDGEFYRDRVKAAGILARLRRQRRIGTAWIVFVSMRSPAARTRECPCHPPFARFLAQELLPWLERRHPGIAGATRRVLVGLSYTGLAAAHAAILYPTRFSHVICQSGSFWWKNCWLPRAYAKRRRASQSAFFLDVGREETQVKVRHPIGVFQRASQIEGVRRFHAALKARGNQAEYAEFDGGHNFASWARSLPKALTWAWAGK